MAEQVSVLRGTIAEQVFKKEATGMYGEDCRDDFLADGEIAVRITLREYRRLVSEVAALRERLRITEGGSK